MPKSAAGFREVELLLAAVGPLGPSCGGGVSSSQRAALTMRVIFPDSAIFARHVRLRVAE